MDIDRHDLVTLDGSTFFTSDRAGDADGTGVAGLFFRDVRHLSTWELRVQGEPVSVLTARNVDYYSTRIYATLASVGVGENPTVTVLRDRIVGDGVHEDIVVSNNCDDPARVRVELSFAADFADLFEVKDDTCRDAVVEVAVGDAEVELSRSRYGHRRATSLQFSVAGRLSDDRAVFDIDLAPREQWELCVDICCAVGDTEVKPRCGHGGFGQVEPLMPMTLAEWMADAPILETDDDTLAHIYRQSLLDLAALRFRPLPAIDWSLPAAGLPWFMALFGRDSLLSAYMALPFQPHLAQTTLRTLAHLQATEDDPFRDAEPGKILHELRRGTLASTGRTPHSPYFGSHDATPLFLILLDEYHRWTGDDDLVRDLEAAARAALAWIEGPGDRDGDGFLEYQTRSPRGLANQCWKDSWNSVQYADGRLATAPIATCEIQGYAYDARVRAARLARHVWADVPLADRLETDATELQARFDRAYWIPGRGHYALALDADHGAVDALTSNIGHLLWSGIVPRDRAEDLVHHLRGPALASGWGVRTMSTADAGYNPIEYHNGTVWPHDTALVAEGLRRYGYHGAAATLVVGLFDAAASFGYRLPEVFAGFDRRDTTIPVQYPTASSPQAWAAATPLLGLRTLLGLDAGTDGLSATPHLPQPLGEVRLRGIHVRGQRHDAP
ncbi:MAG TPA: glycogen debranching N-terminal domain-containing protein [Dermatophilaceae bacterium]|nr:glycogen debranching N-terminal domain-containing protein [Dermatophilaceae bacterium]